MNLSGLSQYPSHSPCITPDDHKNQPAPETKVSAIRFSRFQPSTGKSLFTERQNIWFQTANRALVLEYPGTTVYRRRCPTRPVRARPATVSASPPVLEYGKNSLVACRMRMARRSEWSLRKYGCSGSGILIDRRFVDRFYQRHKQS